MKGFPSASRVIDSLPSIFLNRYSSRTDILLETARSQGNPVKPPLGTVISYCTNDFRFIGKCIEEARRFSHSIVVAVADHFFDGVPENRALLNATYQAHPDCLFVEFAYLPTQ